jgi:hypothetical protein
VSDTPETIDGFETGNTVAPNTRAPLPTGEVGELVEDYTPAEIEFLQCLLDRYSEGGGIIDLGSDHPAFMVIVRRYVATALQSQSDAADKLVDEARQQGQREGKAAVCQWLRGRSATKPEGPSWKEAYALAVEFEHSEIPGTEYEGARQ